jgi:biopolymer transport protein ExbD
MQAFVRAFDVLRAAGIEYIEWGIWEAHPWIRHQPRLPIPKHRIAAYAAPGISLNPYLPSLELPVAPGAKRDRNDDRHDRIWIQVGADGGITYRGKRVDLDELAGIVHRAVSAYEFKLRQTGESHPLPDNRPPLIALIRASKDAPWRTVGSVLGLLQERRFRDVQFAVSPVADLRYDRAEAAALGVPWKDRLPPPEGFHESKLPLRLVEDEPAVRLDVRASEDVVTYAVGEYATRDSRALASRIPHGATVGIRADPEVPFKWVVAAVVQCEAAGATAYRFAPPE